MTHAPMLRVLGLIGVVTFGGGCARPALKSPAEAPRGASAAPIEQLWQSPANLSQRDLYWGPGRTGNAPSLTVEYTVQKKDETGYSKGYNVVAPDGRKWDIKIGKEVQSEIVVSRILWALGYHQPEIYYAAGWKLAGDWEGEGEPARFRLQSDHETAGEWAWRENPFDRSQALHGLVAINILLANWDFKTSNNRIYRSVDGPATQPRFVVQDLGASLGKPRVFPVPIGTRNDIDDFEDTRLVKSVKGDKVVLDYRGLHVDVLEEMQAADVVWGCALLSRLSDAQLDDAFRAADYDAALRGRFIAKIRAKIQEGLALRQVASATGAAQ